MATDLGPAPDVLSNEDIIKQYDGAITQLLRTAVDPQFDAERQVLINQARRNWLFIKGEHFLIPGFASSDDGRQMLDYLSLTDDQDDNGANIRLTPPVNYVGGDCYKFMAVMGSSAPRVKCVADDPQDPDSIRSGHSADVNARDLWIKNKIDRRWKALAFHQYATGPCYIRGLWNTDARKYGSTVEPEIEVTQRPDGTPVPSVKGQQSYANGDAEISIHSVFDISHNFDAKEIEDCNYFRCERNRSKWDLLSKYPERLGQYRKDQDLPDEGSASFVAASEAKESTSSPSNTSRSKNANQWRFAEYWIAPEQFEAIDDDSGREIFKRQFPQGLYVARAGTVTCEIDNRNVADEWVVCRVGRSEYIMERPICADGVPMNMAINDLFGMGLETIQRAVTVTLMDSQLFDRDTLANKQAVPNEILPVLMPPSGDVGKSVYQIPPARLGDQVLPFEDRSRATMQDITGIRPELTGGGQSFQTYREAKQRKDQALQQLAPHAQEMRWAAEGVATNLIKLRSKYGSGTVKATRKGAFGAETDVVDMAELKDGGWHAESDDQFPMSASDKRDALYSMLKEFPPDVQAALSILDPINIEEVLEIIQIPGFQSALSDQKQKTLADIQQLLQEQPLDGPPAPDGLPGPKSPSRPPDAYDNAPIVASIMAKWMISKTGQSAKNSNPPGFENVQASWQAYFNMAQPPAPPPIPPVKLSMGTTLKLEDDPNLIRPLLAAAGVNVPDNPPAMPAPGPQDMGAPGPMGSAPQASPLPPLPPSGPQAPAIQ